MRFENVQTYKGNTVKKKTDREYEELFEHLVEFTDFKSVADIDNQSKLDKYFSDNKKIALSFGRKWNDTDKFKNAMKSAWRNILEKPQVSRRIIKRRIEQVIESKTLFKTYDEAKRMNLVAINEKQKEVFKSFIKVKGKTKIRYRDNKGRFARGPKID